MTILWERGFGKPSQVPSGSCQASAFAMSEFVGFQGSLGEEVGLVLKVP